MTPSTPSGRRLLDLAMFKDGRKWPVIEISPEFLTEQLEAVEREAVEAYRLALRTKIAAIRPPDRFVALDGTWEQGLSEASVLRLIEGENPE